MTTSFEAPAGAHVRAIAPVVAGRSRRLPVAGRERSSSSGGARVRSGSRSRVEAAVQLVSVRGRVEDDPPGSLLIIAAKVS
jgi:hypothetical protein